MRASKIMGKTIYRMPKWIGRKKEREDREG